MGAVTSASLCAVACELGETRRRLGAAGNVEYYGVLAAWVSCE